MQLLRGLELPTQFLLTIVVANAMGSSEFGRFGILLSFQAVLAVIGACGFDELLQRAIGRHRDNFEKYTVTALGSRIRAAGLVLSFSIVAGGVAAAASGYEGLFAAVVLLAFATAFNLVSSIFTAVALSKSNVTIPFAASLLSWVFPLILALAGFVDSLDSYAGVLAAGAATRLVITLLWATRSMHLSGVIRSSLGLKAGFKLLENKRSHASIVIYALNNQVLARHGDILIAGIMGVSLSLIGSYSLAFQITAMANSFLMMGLGAVVLSYLSEKAGNVLALGQAWRRISGVAALIAAGPISVLALISPELVEIIFGDNYPQLTGLILGLCAAQWGNRLGGGGTNTGALIAAGMSETVARSSIFGALLNVSLNLALVAWLGIYGLVLATGISLLTIGVLNSFSLSRALGARPPIKTLIGLSSVVICAIVMTAIGAQAFVRLAVAAFLVVIWAIAIFVVVRRFKAM